MNSSNESTLKSNYPNIQRTLENSKQNFPLSNNIPHATINN